MKSFRIGKDIRIQWQFTVNGAVQDLSSYENIELELKDEMGRRCVLPHSIAYDTVTATFFGKDQRRLGMYSLTLYINRGKPGATAEDACDAFELVECTHMERSAPDDLSVEHLGIKNNIIIGVKGQDAYETWLSEGHVGTKADFLKWMQKPAKDAATQVTKLNTEITANEDERKKSEVGRTTAEAERVEAEKKRVEAEKQRVIDEEIRKTSEIDRANVFVTMKDSTTNAIKSTARVSEAAKQAATEANDATKRAKDATSLAMSATGLANELNAHQPTIGTNGNWHTWNPYTDTYVDSGKPSKGDVFFPTLTVDLATMRLRMRYEGPSSEAMQNRFKLDGKTGKLLYNLD